MADRIWRYGLTADEWFHIACEGDDSEIVPCCGNIGLIRDLVRELMVFQAPEESGWRKSIGSHLLQAVEAYSDQHDLCRREKFPLFNRVLDGIRTGERKESDDAESRLLRQAHPGLAGGDQGRRRSMVCLHA